jgi:hypothetical protein
LCRKKKALRYEAIEVTMDANRVLKLEGLHEDCSREDLKVPLAPSKADGYLLLRAFA